MVPISAILEFGLFAEGIAIYLVTRKRRESDRAGA
jgi:hypothetical protein